MPSLHPDDRAPISPAAAPIVVLDTNVVLDWFVYADPTLIPLADAIRRRAVQWLGCAAMQAELAHVLRHGNLNREGFSAEQVLTLTRQWQSLLELPSVLPLQRLRCRDTSDQVFLDLALHAGARWLLSRDRALLSLARKAAAHGLCILTPKAWAMTAAS